MCGACLRIFNLSFLRVRSHHSVEQMVLKGLTRFKAFNFTKYTLIEKDHLGDWSPEKDCS